MNLQDKEKILSLLDAFRKDHQGPDQKLTVWNYSTLRNEMNRELDEIIKKDNLITPESGLKGVKNEQIIK